MSNKHKHNDPSAANNPAEEGAATFDNFEEAADETQAPATEADEAEQVIEAEGGEIDALRADLDTVNAALEKEKKEYLFLMAEFDNFRKRTVKEKAEIIRNASEKVLEQLLPIVDDFERGIESLKAADADDPARQGMVLIYNKLMKFLEKNGVTPVESTGNDFNPDLHEAIAMVPAPEPEAVNKVIDTPTRGYMLNDKVLRHAKVVVGQ